MATRALRLSPVIPPRSTQLDLLDGRRKKRAPKARTPEHHEQAALMTWASLPVTLARYPELALLHAIPNGGHRFISVARAMKAEGVKAGVPDLDLPVARGGYVGLRIEMKAMDGAVTREQTWWLEQLGAHGHKAVVCHGWEAARAVIEAYLALAPTQIERAPYVAPEPVFEPNPTTVENLPDGRD